MVLEHQPGSTSSGVVMQLLHKSIGEWGSTVFGFIILIVAGSVAINAIFFSRETASNLQSSDTGRLALMEGSSTVTATTITQQAITTPLRMLLPTVNLALDIDNSTINIESNIWPLSDTAAHYANFTPGLGSERGTMLLYGHNTSSVMRQSNDLTIGDELVLIDENNRNWRFTLDKTENVKPESVGFIYEDVPFRVVIFTCNGWNDQFRRLMYFTPRTSM